MPRQTTPACRFIGIWAAQARDRRIRGGLHLGDELFGDLEHLGGGERSRLLHEVDGAGIERDLHAFGQREILADLDRRTGERARVGVEGTREQAAVRAHVEEQALRVARLDDREVEQRCELSGLEVHHAEADLAAQSAGERAGLDEHEQVAERERGVVAEVEVALAVAADDTGAHLAGPGGQVDAVEHGQRCLAGRRRERLGDALHQLEALHLCGVAGEQPVEADVEPVEVVEVDEGGHDFVVVDLAVAVIVGTAFGKIVASLVEDIVMPAIGALGRVDFKNLMIQVGDAKILYGKFIQTCVDFTIIALAIFVAIKVMNRLYRRQEAAPAAPPRQEVLLEEIRDLLRRKP